MQQRRAQVGVLTFNAVIEVSFIGGCPLPFCYFDGCLFTDSKMVISNLQVLSCSIMLFAAVAPDTKVAPYLCPLPFQAIPRDVKRCAPAPLRWATPSFLSGIYGSKTAAK